MFRKLTAKLIDRIDPVNRALIGGPLMLVACYVTVFLLSIGGRTTFPDAFIDALINVGALCFWAALAWLLNLRVVLDRSAGFQALAHPLLGFFFAVAWYFSVTVLLGWRAGQFSGAFSVRPFSSVAFIWQAFQGLTVYALVVALAVIRRLLDARLASDLASDLANKPLIGMSDEPANQTTPSAARSSPSRLLVRSEDEFISVPIDEIIHIERAGDYAQLVTTRGQHLTRKSLAELERQLPMERFIRVHRSQLIHLDALQSAEPIGGGRMRAYLSGDIAVETSRAGARQLRERAG